MKHWKMRYLAQRLCGYPRWLAAIRATLITREQHDAAWTAAIRDVLGEPGDK